MGRKENRTAIKEMSIKKSINRVKNIFLGSVVLLVGIVILQNITTVTNKDYIPRIFGATYLNVLSGSMEPELKVNDLAIGFNVKDSSKLKVGDVITFKEGNMLATHRIIEIKDNGNAFVTKGDANEIKDDRLVTSEQIVSKYAFKIPKAGLVVAKLQDKNFLGLLWLLIMYFLFKEIFIEYKNMKKNKLSKKEENRELVENV